jgi:hypothetical protein
VCGTGEVDGLAFVLEAINAKARYLGTGDETVLWRGSTSGGAVLRSLKARDAQMMSQILSADDVAEEPG